MAKRLHQDQKTEISHRFTASLKVQVKLDKLEYGAKVYLFFESQSCFEMRIIKMWRMDVNILALIRM